MREVFYEESARTLKEKSESTKYMIFKIVSIFSWVLFGVWIFLFIFFFNVLEGNVLLNIIVSLIPSVGFMISGILFGKFKNKFYIDYDYTFITGEIRISKVIKQIKRRKVMVFSTSLIEKIGKYGSETFDVYNNMRGIKKYILTSNNTPAEDKDFYYMVVNQGEKKLLILECTQLFMVNVIKFTNRMVIEKDFK